ncbi:hypothetical protein UR09_04350 [Candidatus Nitromaritima sp. SCGC AAA799-A02]|nr:hypothetical protein UR09_04350 [Candidatus Nitromaritima sp. SCGC AAA799-A02]KMP11594.1 hypothetical protein UZ36_03865 [Candidatus Nitromaritima sp. SCGC AAA799-C22]
MKKLAFAFLTAVAVFCLTASAFAGTINPGDSTTCNNASSITLEASGSHPTDRGNANAVIWKSSNFTTIPITLGATDFNGIPGGSAGNKKDSKFKCKNSTQCVPGATDSVAVNMAEKHSMGRSKVTLTGQTNFSRGDSIGDISGEVRITNTGTIAISVSCG